MNIQPISTPVLPQPPPDTSMAMRESKSLTQLQDKPITEQAAKPTKPVSQQQLEAAVKSVREYVQPFNSNLEFSIDDETDIVVVKIVDVATREVIRQIPSEEIVAMAKALDNIKGLFIKQMA